MIHGLDGKPIGKAALSDAPSGVLIRLSLEPGALAPGWHGLHLHEKAVCSDVSAGGYKLSGGHVGHGMGGKAHGLLNPAGPEPGDLPNIYIPEKAAGVVMAEFFTPFASLSATPVAGRAALLDADGSALIIHAKADDHMSQPIGGAGDRIACAAINR
ncbi:MAG: superoxide dismutase family protein [Hyphomonadaceae bacterium]